MYYLDVFMYVFLVLVSMYIIINLKGMPRLECSLLALAVIVAVVVTLQYSFCKTYLVERFIDTTTSKNVLDYKQEILNEDVTDISDRLKTYLTIFNSSSINGTTRVWKNIAPSTSVQQSFTFFTDAVYDKKNGVYLGQNSVTGPFSSDLKIQFTNTYTIVIACKHGNLMVNNTNSEMELLKLYANSPNNNGVSLFIQAGSILNSNNSQVGNLLMQYGNDEPRPCLASTTDKLINLDKDILTFYFIIKDTDNVRVLAMREGSNQATISTILKFTVSNTTTTFSNKEMVINRLKNWNGNLFNFAIYDTALSDDNVSKLYTHVMNNYYLYKDQAYSSMMQKYNDILAAIQNMTKCPFDGSTCKTCPSVKNWADVNQLLNTPNTCKKSIHQFCSANPTHPACKCWDTNDSMYASDACRLYRNIFTNDKSATLDSMTDDNIGYIKNKYGLIYPTECPTQITKAEYLTNTYPNYDWNKLKVSTDGVHDKLQSAYPDDEVIPKKTMKDGVSVTNYIKNDPNLNKDIATLPNKIMQQAYLDRNAKMGAEADKILPPPDTFFTKFMKVVLPNS